MSLKQIIKVILKKVNITLLRGDVRGEVLNMYGEQLPDELIKNARLKKSREDVLHDIPKGGVVVEVGVAYGEFTDKILDVIKPSKFIAIDAFGQLPIVANQGDKDLDDIQTSQHYKYYQSKYLNNINEGNFEMMRGYSWEEIDKLPDNSVDYIYVDADHSYNSVIKDIEALKNKVKQDGIIQFNDYTCFDIYSLQPYGVYKAVNEFLIRENYEILYLCFEKFGFYDVVVKKKK